jgi:endonuclease/exonuclease/phosphatase family metal-dependent hydrolase
MADGLALPGEPVLLCGDANLRPTGSGTYAELQSSGFSGPAPGIDQILVRGLPSSAPTVWAEERRRVHGRLLSDHAPVELTVG